MAVNFDLVLLHGPSFCGRDVYHLRETSTSHETVCPQELYYKNQTVGLRDVILQVVGLLKKNKKVVVDDEMAVSSTRESYVRMVQRKLTAKKIALVSVLPEHGREQLYWLREFCLAEQRPEISLQDSAINKWFDKDDVQNVSFTSDKVNKPNEDEGYKLFEKVMPLTTCSMYKFDIPAMFVQWEGIIQSSSDGLMLQRSIVHVCEEWTSVAVCGRIIVLCDGSHIKQGTTNRVQEEDIVQILSELVNKFDGCPVYVLYVNNLLEAGSYIQPPNPGMIAFLQKIHSINLQSKHTVYLGHSSSHLKMAEQAGLRNIKISRVLQQPSLVKSSHIYNTPAIPTFLKNLDIVQSPNDLKTPIIPLFDDLDQFNDHHVVDQMTNGRQHYLFAKDSDTLKKFNDEYVELATKVEEPASKIEAKMNSKYGDNSENLGLTVSRHKLSRSLSSDREIPKWMMSRMKKGDPASVEEDSEKPSTSRSDSTGSTDMKTRQTVYVMTEKELTEVAKDILKQAGREDILDRITSENIKKRTSIDKSQDMSSEECETDNSKSVKCASLSKDKETVCDKLLNSSENIAANVPIETRDVIDETEHCVKDTVLLSKRTDESSRKQEAEHLVGGSEGGAKNHHKEMAVLNDLLQDDTVRRESPKKTRSPYKRSAVTCILEETFETPESPTKKQKSVKSVHKTNEQSITKTTCAGDTCKAPDLSILDEIFS